MNKAFIALGSNIHPRSLYLKRAIESLKKYDRIKLKKESSIYETEPIGVTDQDKFLNMVIEIDTSLGPIELLELCQTVEQSLNRKREVRWGPRTIDLDILLYNQENIISENLTIPHPRMHERAFVLIPLSEISPSIAIPTIDKSSTAILDEMSRKEKKGVVKWVPMNGEEE